MRLLDKMFRKYESVFVYIIECRDGTLYTGITNNVQRRLQEHRTGKGATYTKIHGVKRLLGYRRFKDRSEAMREEKRIKKLSHKKKRELVENWKK